MRQLKSVVLAAALLGSCMQSHAAATSSAALGPLTFTLFDLNPLDDTGPSVTFTNLVDAEFGSAVFANVFQSDPNASDSQFAGGATDFDPVGIHVNTGLAWSMATVGGSGEASGATLHVSGHAAGTTSTVPFSFHSSNYSASVYAPYFFNAVGFTVSANTLLVITAESTVSAGVSSAFDPSSSYQIELADAETMLYVIGPSASGNSGAPQTSSDAHSLNIGNVIVYGDGCTSSYCYGPNAASETRTLSVSFLNATGGNLAGTLQASATVNGTSFMQAVPEPETYAMMLGGLVVVAQLARRRSAC